MFQLLHQPFSNEGGATFRLAKSVYNYVCVYLKLSLLQRVHLMWSMSAIAYNALSGIKLTVCVTITHKHAPLYSIG